MLHWNRRIVLLTALVLGAGVLAAARRRHSLGATRVPGLGARATFHVLRPWPEHLTPSVDRRGTRGSRGVARRRLLVYVLVVSSGTFALTGSSAG